MDMIDLSKKMAALSEKINLCSHLLRDKSCIDEAGRFAKALNKFETLIDEVSKGNKPINNELKQAMQQVFKEDITEIEELGEFSKKVLGKKVAGIKNSPFIDYLQKIQSEIIKKDKAEFALLVIRRTSAEPLIKIVEGSTEGLLLQIRKLGALSEEQLETEKRHLLKDVDGLALLAKTAGVKLKPSYKPETIFKKLVELAKRYYENTG